uniref:Sulfotransferase family cytosolic 1B member 1-like n=1 Tax=Saccoglossus kowalevskii TaxID=10224 RepID=A0ABM0MH46_SACKO|nr:PREDICTED: sulfotransferase family cytosolic 1B member 1-like [Saccoglossus kowalevskii]
MSAEEAKPPWNHSYYMWPGYLMPTSSNTVKNITHFEVRDDDVFIVTYPRSGTYWTTRVVRAIMTLNKSTMDVNHEIMNNLFFTLHWGPFHNFPDLIKLGSAIDRYNERSSPREIGLHLLPKLLPTQYHEKKPQTVYIQRNPKDVAVSCYFMHFACAILGKPNSWDHYFTEFLNGNGNGKDPRKIYHRIAHFLERPMTDEEMDVVIRVCDFKYMQDFFLSDPVAQYFIEKDEKYMRRGKVGDWKKYFTVAQNEAFDKVYCEEMKGYEELKYDF